MQLSKLEAFYNAANENLQALKESGERINEEIAKASETVSQLEQVLEDTRSLVAAEVEGGE